MRVLLDECVPIQVKSDLAGYEVRTVGRMGWAGKNGELLRLAATWFDVFGTVDRSLKHQQNFAGLRLGLVTLVARSSEIEVLRPPIPRLKHALRKVKPGQVVRISG